MVYRKKIGSLTCDYVADEGKRVCYILVPLPVKESDLETWAKRYGYNIVAIRGMDWDHDLTPWPAPCVLPQDEDFKGHSGEFLSLLRHHVLPEMERVLGLQVSIERTLVGISLSGLFALWAWMNGDDFAHIGSVSGSFWYDGFPDWLKKNVIHKNGTAYFSLGNQESKDGERRFSMVQADTRIIVKTLQDANVRAMFEQTKGGHFSPLAPRIEKLLQGLDNLSKNEL